MINLKILIREDYTEIYRWFKVFTRVLIRQRHEGQAWRGDLAMEAETGVKPVEYRRRDQNPKDVPSGS